MADIKERQYFTKLKEIMAGNTAAWEGVYDSKEQAIVAAKRLVRTVFGSITEESKAKSPTTKPRIMSQIKGMSDLLTDLQDYIATLTDQDKAKAKEYVEGIIAQDSKIGIMNTVKRVLSFKDQKPALSEYLSVKTDETIEEGTKNQVNTFIKWSQENLKFLDFTTIITSLAPTLGSMAILSGLDASGIFRRTPELTIKKACFLGPVPLQHVREIEVARSGQKLKFRATGSVFLAKQEGGGTDAVRVSGKLYRDEVIMLLLLFSLYEWGTGRVKDLDLSNPETTFDMELIRKKKNMLKVDTEMANAGVEAHNTFPFVSRHVIIPNCYIETLSFEERIENGIDVINYDVLLRTFAKQKSFKVWNSDDPNIKYVSTVYNEKLHFHKMFEYGINAIWRHIQAESLSINSAYWKVGVTKAGMVGNAQARDVYYNLDAFDVAGTFAMGAMGFVGKTFATLGVEAVINAISGVIS